VSEIDLSIVGKKTKPSVFEYTWKDVVLYALGIGAQADELSFVYEDAPGGLKVLPSFCVIPGFVGTTIDFGVELDMTRIVHGDQLIRLYRPIAPEGKIVVLGEVTDIYDKIKAAVFKIRVQGKTEEGELLFETESSQYYRGAGGFGGNPGPKAEPLDPPKGAAPDFSVSYAIPENQAALYRLNGDLSLIHIDPGFAEKSGFERPILHGLCSFGYATRAILCSLCEGDVTRFKEFKARSSGVVVPGDTLTTQGWKGNGGRYIIQARTGQGVVMSHAYAIIEE